MKRVGISGFEGIYENACQTMLERFRERGKSKTYAQVFPKGELSKENKEKLVNLVKDIEPSGFMWHATISHFIYILKHGYDAWIESGKDRIIEWDPKARIHFDSAEEAFKIGLELGRKLKEEVV